MGKQKLSQMKMFPQSTYTRSDTNEYEENKLKFSTSEQAYLQVQCTQSTCIPTENLFVFMS